MSKSSKKKAPASKKSSKPEKASPKHAAAQAKVNAKAPVELNDDEREALEEQEEIAALSQTGGAGGAGGLAAIKPGETSTSLKNFRHHPDMENFYRFIFENDLRYEALEIIEDILDEKQMRKKVKLAKTKLH